MVLRESISLSGSIRQIKTEINKGDVILHHNPHKIVFMSKTRTIFKKDVCFYKKINSNSQMLAVSNC